jgi:putative tryptophan/tyrosine transport system substrate-binding protein
MGVCGMRNLAPEIFGVILALGPFAAPFNAEAQQTGKVSRVGVLALSPAVANGPDVAAFRERLGQLAYVEGQNLHIETRFADGEIGRLPPLAAELVQMNVDVIVTITTPAAQAALAATATIPIVMAGSADPVGLGLVASLAHPGGNVTGVTNNPGPDFMAKHLQLLKEAAPNASRVAVLMMNHRVEWAYFNAMQAAGATLGVTPVSVIVDRLPQFDGAALTRVRPDALYTFPNAINGAHTHAIVNFATTHRLPTMFVERPPVAAGGLLSYSVNWLDLRRRAAVFVDKILKGAKPADLPVEEPTRFSLVINLKTANALGLTIPQSVLIRADEVIH